MRLHSGGVVTVNTDFFDITVNGKFHGNTWDNHRVNSRWRFRVTANRLVQNPLLRQASFELLVAGNGVREVQVTDVFSQLVAYADFATQYDFAYYHSMQGGTVENDLRAYARYEKARFKLQQLFGLRVGQFTRWVGRGCPERWM